MMDSFDAGRCRGGVISGDDLPRRERLQLVKELERLAFSDIGALFRPDGTLIPFQELPADVAAAVVVMESTETVTRGADGEVVTKRTFKVELADKLKSLELLGLHLGMFPREVSHEG